MTGHGPTSPDFINGIRAELIQYGTVKGLSGLEGRILRGLDAAGMLAVNETRIKLEAIATRLGANMNKFEQLTHDLHVGGIWENADRLTAASEPEVQVWMIASDMVSEGEKSEAQFVADFQRLNTDLDRAAADPHAAAYAAKARMVEAARAKFVLKGGIPVSTTDSFVEMAVCGHNVGIVNNGDILFVGAKELEYSVLEQRGLRPEMRADRGRESPFYVDAKGKPVVKKLYDGLAIVLDGDMALAEELAWTAVDTRFDEAIMGAFDIKPYEWTEDMPDARMGDHIILTQALKEKLKSLVIDAGGTFHASDVHRAVAIADPLDSSVATVTVRMYDGRAATVKVRYVGSYDDIDHPHVDANIRNHKIDIAD